MSSPLYVVTAKNRMTGEREIVSRPAPKVEALQMKLRYTNMRGTHKPYMYLKLELYNEQLELKFK